ncbi:MAG TPA: hypothetical protein VI279_00890 [Rhodocyclaceae bacterium]
MRTVLLLLSSVLLLAGCGGDSASYMVDGNREHSLSLFRDKPWPWSNWELNLVVTREPDCMRRHRLKDANGDGNFKVELYKTDTGAYILRQGKKWYVAETGKCQFQQFKETPPEPGELLGTFEDKGEGMKFTASEAKPKAAAAEPAVAAAEAPAAR